MKYLPLYIVLGMLITQACEYSSPEAAITSSIEEVRKSLVPDKRVAILEVEPIQEDGVWKLVGSTNVEGAKNAVLEKVKAVHPGITENILQLPDPAMEGKNYAVVSVSVCNIRSKPKHSAELATQALMGTPLRVYQEKDGWFRVQTPDDYLGWLDGPAMERMDKASYEQWMNKGKVVYLSDFGFSYIEPTKSSLRGSDLAAGNILAATGVTENGFVQVQYPGGKLAYIQEPEVSNYQEWLASRIPNVENILTTAQTFMGRPYLWGGTSGKGVDCSGFTKTVFFMNGLMLPRDASQQVHVGVEIPTDSTLVNLEAGDLLFFGRKATDEQAEKIWHVAIYMGEGKMIHSSGTVMVESLRRSDPDFNEDRWKTFVRAKRMLEEPTANGVPFLKDLPFYTITNNG